MRARSKALGLAAAALLLICGCARPHAKTTSETLLTERMAEVLLRDNRPADAERAFRDVLKEDPKNPGVYDGLGVALMMQGRFRDALPYLDKAVALGPENGSYRNNRGVARMELGQYKEAAEDFNVAEKSQNPDDRLSATINRGRLDQRQGDFTGAEQEFTNALARDPKSFAASLGRGVAREAKGDLQGAAEDYLLCVKLEPSSAEANLRLGTCLVALHKVDLGRRYLQKAAEIDPDGDAGARARLELDKTPKSPS